jgi:hypothetical protein
MQNQMVTSIWFDLIWCDCCCWFVVVRLLLAVPLVVVDIAWLLRVLLAWIAVIASVDWATCFRNVHRSYYLIHSCRYCVALSSVWVSDDFTTTVVVVRCIRLLIFLVVIDQLQVVLFLVLL